MKKEPLFERMGRIFKPSYTEDGKEECSCCNNLFSAKDVQFKRFWEPYFEKIKGGYFCNKCLEDVDVQILIRAAKDRGRHLILGKRG